MRYTLEELWNGNIAPYKNCGMGDPEVNEIMELMERNREELMEVLNKKESDIFQKYGDCVEEYIYLISMHAFCEGFRVGSKLLCQALLEN